MGKLPAYAGVAALAGLIIGLIFEVAALEADGRGARPPIAPLTDADFYDNGHPSEAKVALGQALFFDKMLSGNRNIACATCHHPRHASTDQVSLGLGTGASGLGPARIAGADQPVFGRVPRNSPALFNRGAREFATMFHDGRVERDTNGTWPSGFWTPARERLPDGLDNVLAARLRTIPAYVALFRDAYPGVAEAEDINFVHAANAIAAFEATAFRADESPFDRYLRSGDTGALNRASDGALVLASGYLEVVITR